MNLLKIYAYWLNKQPIYYFHVFRWFPRFCLLFTHSHFHRRFYQMLHTLTIYIHLVPISLINQNTLLCRWNNQEEIITVVWIYFPDFPVTPCWAMFLLLEERPYVALLNWFDLLSSVVYRQTFTNAFKLMGRTKLCSINMYINYN